MDTTGTLNLQPYQSVSEPMMTPELSRACARAVQIVFHDGTTLSAGRASLFGVDLGVDIAHAVE